MGEGLTILIRTHKRPIALKNCLESLRVQTEKNFKVIIISDVIEDDINAIKKEFSDLDITIKKMHNKIPHPFTGGYFNRVINDIETSHISFIDDDDRAKSVDYVRKIMEKIKMGTKVIIFKILLCGRTVLPESFNWKKFPQSGHVGTISYCVDKDLLQQNPWSTELPAPDFIFIRDVFNAIDWENEVVWLDEVLAETSIIPGQGKGE